MTLRAKPPRFLSQEWRNVLLKLFPPLLLETFWARFEPAPLKRIHPHPRDVNIQFYDVLQLPGEAEPRTHLYIVKGDPNSYISSTTFIHTFFHDFDADWAINLIFNGKNYENSIYYGMTREEIKAFWERNRDEAATLGTRMHANIETFYNGFSVEASFLDTEEWGHFQRYLEEHPGLEPFRTEWEVFDEEHLISGSIDMVYYDPERPGYLIIKDWKRSKEIKWSNRERGKGVLQHLTDTNGVHYSLQVNLYKWILEKNYGVRISRLFMVRFHPNSDSYEEIEVEDMQEEIRSMVAERLAMLNNREE